MPPGPPPPNPSLCNPLVLMHYEILWLLENNDAQSMCVCTCTCAHVRACVCVCRGEEMSENWRMRFNVFSQGVSLGCSVILLIGQPANSRVSQMVRPIGFHCELVYNVFIVSCYGYKLLLKDFMSCTVGRSVWTLVWSSPQTKVLN